MRSSAPLGRLAAAVVSVALSCGLALGSPAAAAAVPPELDPTPGPASGPPSVAPPAAVPSAGEPIPAPAPTASARSIPQPRAQGDLVTPGRPPAASGWITSQEWNITPAMDKVPPRLPVFARDVALTKPAASAKLTIAGLGLYAPTTNGAAASSAVLQPTQSRFEKSVEYRTYDVTRLVSQGTNRVGVRLAGGVYNEVRTPGRYTKLVHLGGPLGFTARLDVRYSDGTAQSWDTSSGWWTRPAGTTLSDWYGGEDYDARAEPVGWERPASALTTAAGWRPAVVANISRSIALFPQTMPPVVAKTPVAAKSVTKLADGSSVVDYGRYVTGQPRLSLTAPAGTSIRLYPAERVKGGVPDQSTILAGSKNPVYDQYTFAGRGREEWNPQFVYHGFRYLRVTGASALSLSAANFSAVPVGPDLRVTGTASTSDATFNRLLELTDIAIDANLQGILTDCPNREKLGWLEQDHLLFDLLAARRDVGPVMRNTVRLMIESQRADGSLPEIAPEVVSFGGGFSDDIHWGGALISIPWQLYREYGDKATLASAYPAQQRYVRSLQARSSGYLISFGLGDWISPAKGRQTQLTVSMGYYAAMRRMVDNATILGKPSDAAAYAATASQIRAAINAKYYRDGLYGSEQATNAMAVALGIAPDAERAKASLVSVMQGWQGHFNTGEIGLAYLYDALHAIGRDDLLWTAAMQSTAPSFKWFVTSGSPALPEAWSGMDGGSSLAHIMLGYPAQWAYTGLAGIGQASDSVAYSHPLIRPAVFTGPDKVTVTRETVRGRIGVSWTRSGGTASVTVTVPDKIGRATVILPSGTRDVGPGTTTLTTTLGARPYAAAAFGVPTGTLWKLPWSAAIWGTVGGKVKTIIYAQWQATGFTAPKVALPPGSRVWKRRTAATIYVTDPAGAVHALTAAEWKALGYPKATIV